MELESTRIFVKVIQQGSFSKAAALMKLPLSTISRTISRLEAEVGTKLIQRTTRSLKLTPAGRVYFENAVGPIQLLEDARRSLQGNDSVIAGKIKITATEDLGKYAITPIIAALSLDYPELSFEMNYTDQLIDIMGEGYDLAIRVGQMKSSRLRAKKVGEISLVLVASPEYLNGKPKIREPQDLEQHSLMTFSADSNPHLRLSSKLKNNSVNVNYKMQSNHMDSLITLASLGAGVAIVPHFTCKNLLAEKKLVRVLQDWNLGSHPTYIVTTGGSSLSAKVKLASDRLYEALSKILK